MNEELVMIMITIRKTVVVMIVIMVAVVAGARRFKGSTTKGEEKEAKGSFCRLEDVQRRSIA